MEGDNILDPNNPPQPNQPPRVRTLVEYFRPSHQGYRNTIELTQGANVTHLRSDSIRFHTMFKVQTSLSTHLGIARKKVGTSESKTRRP